MWTPLYYGIPSAIQTPLKRHTSNLGTSPICTPLSNRHLCNAPTCLVWNPILYNLPTSNTDTSPGVFSLLRKSVSCPNLLKYKPFVLAEKMTKVVYVGCGRTVIIAICISAPVCLITLAVMLHIYLRDRRSSMLHKNLIESDPEFGEKKMPESIQEIIEYDQTYSGWFKNSRLERVAQRLKYFYSFTNTLIFSPFKSMFTSFL